MKKFYLIAALAMAVSAGAYAQNDVPNRLIVNSKLGAKAYAVEHVDSITFARKEGEVKANVEFVSYEKSETDGDVVTVKVTRTDANSSFLIDVLPTNTAKQYDDATLARYFEMTGNTHKFNQDFEAGRLSGFAQEFTANTSYTVVTLAYDEYGVPCESSRAEFTTPKVATVGNPTVSYTIDETTRTSFTLTVVPNKDCAEFYWCSFEKGEAQKQFEQWGPMMGFSNIESMVRQWSGQPYTGETTNTWNDMEPGHDYEVLVLPIDVNGNFGDLVSIYVSTDKQGGQGVAQVDVNVGKYENISGSYVQTVTFTPNDQTALFRDVIVTKAGYDQNGGDNWAKEYLLQDQPYTGWNHYETDVYQVELKPNTEHYAIAIAKNANGEWGPLVKKAFTTPSAPSNVASMKNVAVPQRIVASPRTKLSGVAPVKRSVKLIRE